MGARGFGGAKPDPERRLPWLIWLPVESDFVPD